MGRFRAFLIEANGLTFRDETTGYHHGQSDARLNIAVNGEAVGYIDYVIYEDKIHISMIEISAAAKRKGYATAALKHLQKNNPDTEIDFGMLTSDGSALHQSMSFVKVPNELYAEDFEKLDQMKLDRERLTQQQKALSKKDDKYWELENEIDDLAYDIEKEETYFSIRKIKPYKTLIKV